MSSVCVPLFSFSLQQECGILFSTTHKGDGLCYPSAIYAPLNSGISRISFVLFFFVFLYRLSLNKITLKKKN